MSAMPVARFIADESADSGTNRDAETTGEGSQGKTGESADECATASAGISENFFSLLKIWKKTSLALFYSMKHYVNKAQEKGR